MRKLLILLFVFLATCLLAEPDTTKILTPREICDLRGHIILEFQIYRDNVDPQFQDYPDSTVMYYYVNNRQKGTINWCQRCHTWIGVPELETPKTKVIWRKYEEKIDSTNTDSTFSN
ncbi:MAG: hypothetical protein KGY74_05235 [Candidatus Cloacimonetes bacterium]|nr:hypothetical protein [Candidatus Cloacimonadota bacterium]